MNIPRQCLGICLVLLLLTTGALADDGDAPKPADAEEAIEAFNALSELNESLRASFGDSLSMPGDAHAPVVPPSLSWEGSDGSGQYTVVGDAAFVMLQSRGTGGVTHYQLAKVTPQAIERFELAGTDTAKNGENVFVVFPGFWSGDPAFISSHGDIWRYRKGVDGPLKQERLKGFDPKDCFAFHIMVVGSSTLVYQVCREAGSQETLFARGTHEFGRVDEELNVSVGLSFELGSHPRLGKLLYLPVASRQPADFLYICFERGIVVYDETLKPVAELEYPRSAEERALQAAGVTLGRNRVPFVGTDTLVLMDSLGQTAFLLDAKSLAVKHTLRVATNRYFSRRHRESMCRTGVAVDGQRLVVQQEGNPTISSYLTTQSGHAEPFFRKMLADPDGRAQVPDGSAAPAIGVARGPDAPKILIFNPVGDVSDVVKRLDWTRDLDALRGNYMLPQLTPTLSGDSVFICVVGGVAELDMATGTLLASYVLKADSPQDVLLNHVETPERHDRLMNSTVPWFTVTNSMVVGGNLQGIYAWKRVARAPAATD